MQTIILPGYDIKNKQWSDELANSLEVEGVIRPIHWDHWDDDTQKFDAKEKAIVISRHARGEKINIIAKSIGTLVASYIIQQIPDQIEKVIFCGIPVNDLEERDNDVIKKAVSQIKDKIVVYQNSNDPHGSYEQIKNFEVDFNLIEKPSYNHEYPYYEEFNKFLVLG
jgi:predicted alpha/beta hydrolase family esterase